MIIKAHGQLRHRFWGDYSAVIGLDFFGNAEHAKLALESGLLGEGWKQSNLPHGLIWTGDVNKLKIIKEKLGALGANVDKIDSLKYSVDYGEVFQIEMEVEHPGQSKMF